jgi:hypothetical protein
VSRAGRLLTGLSASLLLMTIVAGTASAAAPSVTRINLFDPPPGAMPAGTPFHLSHGYCTDLLEEVPLLMRPNTRVDFTVDGSRVKSSPQTFTDPSGGLEHGCIKVKNSVAEFPAGLTAGVHVIEGCWYWAGELDFCLSQAVVFE